MTRRFPALGRALLGLAVTASVVVGFAGVAEAHRLKMFVTAEDGEISGYAFFIGGGRPEGVDVVVKDGKGAEVFRGKTDDQGNFRWRPAAAADYNVTIDAGDGHWVEGGITADRLATAVAVPTPAAPTAAATPAAPIPTATPAVSAPAPSPVAASPSPTCPAPIDAAALAAMVEAQVDRAVARQLRPLIEAQTQAEGRLRLNDVMGGIGMIVGLAGAGLWATSRRRARGEDA